MTVDLFEEKNIGQVLSVPFQVESGQNTKNEVIYYFLQVIRNLDTLRRITGATPGSVPRQVPLILASSFPPLCLYIKNKIKK